MKLDMTSDTKGLVTAIRTLTVLRVRGEEAEKVADALPWFPAVGLLIGGIIFGCAFVPEWYSRGDWPAATGFVALLVGTVLTGGLHLDGFIDFVDGFFGSRDRDRTLAIMKDSHVGAFGVIGAVLLLLAKWICLTRLVEIGHLSWLVVAVVVSRWAQVQLAARHPYARAEGTAAALVKGSSPEHVRRAFRVAVPILLVLSLQQGHALALNMTLLWQPLAILVGCLIMAFLPLILGSIVIARFGQWCRERVGGVTGDLLGAGSEIVEVVVLFAGCMFLS